MPVEIVEAPVPSRSIQTRIWVSFVSRTTSAVRAMMSLQSVLRSQFPQADLRARTVVIDDLGGGQGTQLATDRQRATLSQAVEETCGVLVARAGRVHDFFHGIGRDFVQCPARGDDRALLAAGDRGD